MPITRSDDSTDPLDPYILLIWQKKWLIAAIAVLTAILVYVVLLFVPSVFRANAQIFVNQMATGTDSVTPNPDAVSTLLKSQSLLEQVRDDYVAAFDLEEKPALEQWIKQFEVESYILQDTTVRKEFSPILTLEVESAGSSETRFIMERWIANAIEQYGNYTIKEAVQKRDAFLEQKQALEKELQAVEIKHSEANANMVFHRKILAEKLDLLSQSQLDMPFQNQSENVNIELSMPGTRLSHGLLERQAEIRLQVSAGNAPSTAGAELRAISSAIDDARTSITEAQENLADAKFQQLKTERHRRMLTQNQDAINAAVSRFTVLSAVYEDGSEKLGLPTGGDLRALSMPVTPEKRVWPKRTTTAAIAAVVAAILVVFVIIANAFLTRLSIAARR